MKKFALLLVLILFVLTLCAAVAALAGPPYVTDDPEPVEYRHWEVYFASIFTKDRGVDRNSAAY